MSKKELSAYQLVNLLLAIVIMAIFFYSAVFNPQKANHPIPSSFTLITGQPTVSTGLSRGMSSVMRFKFDQARQFNPYTIQIFVFFLIELILRFFFFFKAGQLSMYFGEKETVLVDSISSGILFIIFFEPFWRELFNTF